MASIREIAEALREIARPGMKPKAIRNAIRERHPEASKKEIVRAAFYAVTEAPTSADAATAELHDFALAERIAEDNADVVVKVSKRKKKKRSTDGSERSLAH
ncbi:MULTISPECIES: hypothetical protein [Methylobacterium]|jgi:hypothetical protein|uniref:Uncharacterized protein n=1 Tax=Methylobacterium radiotolerans (strain ATCC 27329 / DSM 1819 / JCM 2831 / NBRC 15690 / NCIMB 10815 / 0-1) TaxID=426355 RepID=B1M923_METRJ|nr:hypothetical protein [Methylobacterium radiotolerans]ACB27998.1 hypothetical protein Mrad2831_6068 [Methylobacterium radiotolerans JCM 2831]GEN01360.1 hypothetical protein MRA01_58990 [Methylobacterium radiotolerans]